MHRRVLTCLLFLSVSFLASAQTQPAIEGIVTDNRQRPVAFASVSLLILPDSTIFGTSAAGRDGRFTFRKKPSGPYLLAVTAIGFKSRFQNGENQAGKPTTMFHRISLTPEENTLHDVLVTNSRPLVQVKADKIILNVASSINATGSSAFELLRRAPGFRITGEEAILLNGKNGVKVYLDGNKVNLDGKDLIDYLQAFTSANIETIEIITHPSARYDAAGNAGIINIRTKKNANLGFNGNLSASTAFSNYKPKYEAAANFNYRKSKYNFFGNYSLLLANYRITMNFLRRQLNSSNKYTTYDQNYTSRFSKNSHNWKAGVDLFLSKNSKLGLVTDGLASDNNPIRTSTTLIYRDAAKLDSQLISTTIQPKRNVNSNYGINYRYNDSSGRELTTGADFGHYTIRSDGDLYNNYLDNNGSLLSRHDYQVNSLTVFSILSARADYSQKLAGGNIETGAKLSRVVSDNDLEQYNLDGRARTLDTGKTNFFTYKEKITAAYVNYQREISHWQIQLGLRAEFTRSQGVLRTLLYQDLQAVDTSYLNLFPNLVADYKINGKHSLGLAYNKRIDRPAYTNLNPFKFVLDDLYYVEGNPFLKPQFTSEITLTHRYLDLLQTAVSYSRTRDYIINFRDTITTGKTFQTSINVGTQRLVNLSVSLQKTFAPWYDASYSFNIYHEEIDGRFGKNRADLSQNAWNLDISNTFKMKRKCSIELSGYFNSRLLDAPAILHGQWSIDLGLQQKLWKDAATLRLIVHDLFNSLSYYYTRDFGGLYFTNRNKWESRLFKLAFSYRLGNIKLKAPAKSFNSAAEERKRISS